MLSLRTDSFGSYIKANSQEIDFYIEYLNTYRELKTKQRF